jgi:lipoprotein NlpI
MTRPSWTRGLALACAIAACTRDGSGRDVSAAEMILDSASASLERGDDARAIAAYDRAIALDSGISAAYRGRGVAHRNVGRLDLAVRDYDAAIRLDSTMAGTWNSRGFALQLMERYDASIGDFDRALGIDPAYAQALKSRGRSRFYLGHFEAAAADLGEGLKSDSTNLYLPIWIHMAASRAGREDTTRLAGQVARIDLAGWPGPVASFYLGRITAEEFAAAAENPDSAVRANQRCAVAFYLGEYLLWQPAPRPGEARTRLQEAVATCPRQFSEYLGAKADLQRLSAP